MSRNNLLEAISKILTPQFSKRSLTVFPLQINGETRSKTACLTKYFIFEMAFKKEEKSSAFLLKSAALYI